MNNELLMFRAYDTNMGRHCSTGRWTYFTLQEALDGKLYDEKFGSDIDEDHKITQYIGLKDIHREMIYAGDIFRGETSEGIGYWVVEFNEGRFVLRNKGSILTRLMEWIPIFRKVGNIFEHKELINNE